MSPFLSLLARVRSNSPKAFARPRHRREARRRFAPRRLHLEALEDRTVPTTISVANASLNEIGSPSAFISSGSGGLNTPWGITLGPDGNVYVAGNGGAVRRYNGTTGAYLNTFVSQGSGGLAFSNVAGLAFGPDGNLYVTSGETNQVLEYSGSTGAFVQAFVAAGSGGLINPRELTFGPDGNLYLTMWDSNSGAKGVMRYQGPQGGSPGAPLPGSGQTGANFIAPSTPGLLRPLDVVFGPDGNLYVGDGQAFGILRFNGTTGAFIDTFVPAGRGGLTSPRGMVFDADDRLDVSDGGHGLHRYDAQGNFIGDLLVDAVSPSLSPTGMTLDAQGGLLISCDSNTVARYDRGVMVSLSSASGTPVSVAYATADGSALAGTDYYAQSGVVTFAPGQMSRLVLLATQEEAVLDGTETFSVQLSNPTGGATIAAGTATVTIVDPVRQFSVSDAAAIERDHTAHSRGAFVQGIPGIAFINVTFGPDGNLYASTGGGPGEAGVDRYNGTTGAFIDHFVTDGLTPGTRDPQFHGAYLYVESAYANQLLRFDASTGALVDVFIAGGTVALGPFTVGSDGNLYVVDKTSGGVVRYNGATGQSMGTFIAAGSGGLANPNHLTFDPGQNYLYVTSNNTNQVLKYNAQTGAFVGVAASAGLSGPGDIKFGPDGLLYVLSAGNNRIVRYTAGGVYVDDYVPAGSISMDAWFAHMAFGPDGDLYVTTGAPLGPTTLSQIVRFGPENEALFTVTNTTPSTLPLTVNYATADGTAVSTGLHPNYTATSGTLTFPPGATTATIAVPLLDSGSQTASLTFPLTLSSPLAATLSRGQATGTIQPSDQAAKFYVVNDATSALGGTNTAYKYQPTGAAQAPYGLSLNDLDPRGVAANAAGTTEWVVDANKNVYVYSPGGALLGSWSAGGLSSSAQLTGIATNGTDIWLVDSYSDRVYKYAGAASRLSGSQSAASSFNLVSHHNGSTNPQDIVTDGTSFWVVDGTAHMVFKYTLSGSFLGSWAIDPADAHPTGITINPSNVSDIWIVDSGTLKVYQYVGAAGRTSGSQSAAATFALNPYDTNPQGIADPPPADTLLTPAAPPLALTPPSAAAPIVPLVVTGVPSVASRDAVFALLVRESLPGGPAVDVLAGRALTARADSSPPAGLAGGQKPLDPLAMLSPWAGEGIRQESSDALDGSLADGTSQAAALATDGTAPWAGDDTAADQ
jgi:glucose/arabinose dehydrogenase